MSAKERTKNRIRQRLNEKLSSLSTQEDALYSVIKTYVDKARDRAQQVLSVEDTDQFLHQYAGLEQDLDRTFSTCELLTATAEDMIEQQLTDLSATMHEAGDGSTLLASEATICVPSQGERSQVMVPRAATPECKPPDDVLKKELQGMLDRSRMDIEKKAGKERSSSCEKTADHIPAEVVKQQLAKQKDKTEKNLTEKSDGNATAGTTKLEHKSAKIKQSSEESRSSESRDIPKTVPQCVKKTVKNYDSGFEASSQVSAVSEQESFVKGLTRSSSPVKKSTSKKKQKSPKKKKGKKEKATREESQNVKQVEIVVKETQSTESEHSERSDQSPDSMKKEQSVKKDEFDNEQETDQADTPSKDSATEAELEEKPDTDVETTRTQIEEDLGNASASWRDLDKESLALCQGLVQPLLNQEITPVVVSEIISPWCFFVQPNGPQLKQLMAEISGYMTNIGLMEPHLEAPEVGSVCLARFSSDRAFYRACVTKVYTPEAVSHVDVLYLDYGNKEKVMVTELRTLPQTFKLLPPQAACCALAEVMPNNKYCVWTEEDIFNFKHFVCNQQLNCIRACSSSVHTIPHLVKLVGNYPTPTMLARQYVLQSVSIGQFLVNRGSAKPMDMTEQMRHLIKTEEGKEEATILNACLTAAVSPKIQELNDSLVMIAGARPGPNDSLTVRDGERAAQVQKAAKASKKDKVKKADQSGVKTVREKKTESSDSAKEQQKNVKLVRLTNKDGHELADERRDTVKLDGKDEEFVTEKGTKAVSNDSWRDDSFGCSEQNESKTTDGSNKSQSQQARIKTKSAKAEAVDEKGDNVVTKDERKSKNAATKQPNYEDSSSTESSGTCSSVTDRDQTSQKATSHTSDKTQRSSSLQMMTYKTDLTTNPQGKEVMLAHVKSPGHFYVHLVSKEVGQALDDLMRVLNQQFEKMNRRKLSSLSRIFVPEVNKLCCAQFNHDNNFYRAVIKSLPKKDAETEVDTSSEKVRVHYIDFGDEEWVSRHRVYPLSPDLSSIPPLATRCSLAFIRPVAAKDEPDGQWAEASTEKFTSLAGFEKTLHMHIVQGSLSADKTSTKAGEDCVLGVMLVDNTGTEEVCINLELIREGNAELDMTSGKGKTCDTEKLDLLEVWNPMEDDFMSKRNSYKIDVDDAGVATTGYKANDESRICKFFSSGRQCWRGDHCPYKHVLTDSGVSLDQEEVYAVSGNQNKLLPVVHSWVALEVTTILTPRRFYAILPLGRKSLDITTSESEEPEDSLGGISCSETLDDLLTALNVEYNKRPSFQGTTILKATGEIVAARFSQDQQWYRARVLQVTEDKVKVFFVDFGNTEWLPEEDIAEIKPEFLHLPFQALECFLYRAEPAGQQEEWSPEAQRYFRELVDGKTLVGHVRSSSWNNCLTVELFDTTTDTDVNIGDMMVEKGHAVKSSLPTDSSCNVSEPGSSRRSSLSTGSVILIPG